jgi:hypothetical protein
MAYIKNTDTLVEGSSQLFFTEQRAQDAVAADLQALDAAITAEESRAQAAEAALDGRLDVVEGSGEGSILKAKQDAQAYADQKVADLVNSAPAVLDTLKELSDALGGDENFAVTVSNQIGAVDAKVDQEVSDRQAAVSAEQGRAQAAEQALDGRLDVIEGSGEGSVAKAEQDSKDYADGLVSSEQSSRMAADTNLSNRISALEVDPVSKSYVDSAVSSEQSARESADQALDARLDILEQDETTKAYVDQQVSAEQSRAQGAESSLSGRIDVLEQDETTKAYVDQQVSAEQSARQSADQALDGRLDSLESDPVTKSYVDGEVSDLEGQITAEVSARQSAVSSEASARQSADQALDGRLDVLESDPVTKAYVDGEVSDLQGQISQEVSDRQSAVSAEQSARQSADSALSGRLNLLEADPVSKTYVDGEVSDLQGQVDTEKGRIDAILSASQADKDSFAEIVSLINSVDTENDAAFAAYVLSNDAALAEEISDREAAVSAEQSARESADSALDARLDSLELDAVTKTYVDSADANLQSSINGLFGTKSTSDLAEGTNLYYTQARFDSAFAAKSTTGLSEGSNLYFTDARAKSASVVNSSSGSQTDQAMSVSAAKSYIDSADNARLKLDGTNSMTGVLNFTGASGKNITWGTDGGGNIGAPGANRPNYLYVKDTGYFGGFLQVGLNLSWASDGSGDIGSSTNFRPNNVYAKTNVVAGTKLEAPTLNAPSTLSLQSGGVTRMSVSGSSAAVLVPFAMAQGYSIGRTGTAISMTLGSNHGVVGVTDTTAARTITLPSALIGAGRHYTIKDESGGASATNYIRVQPGTAGQTLDGAAYYDIKVPYEALIVYSNGQNWFII